MFDLAVLPVLLPVVAVLVYILISNLGDTTPPKSWDKFDHF